MTGVWLAALALLLAGPLTDAFGRARWTARAPRAAVVLWQAIAIAAVLAAIGSVLALPEEVLRLSADQDRLQFGPDLIAAATIAAIMAGTIVLRLSISLGRLAISTRRRRQRHRDLVDLISQADATREALDLRILDGEHPIAYCVPGRQARVVISTGTTALLSVEQVDAVVAHERAHLRSRHDLVIEAFTALHAAFPRWVRSRVALDSVRVLLEMLADDHAARLHGRGVVASAITAMTAADDTEAAARVRRLEDPDPTVVAQPRRRLAAAMYAGAAAVLLVPTVSLAMPWLTDAYAALPL